jgi:hypothetical protein
MTAPYNVSLESAELQTILIEGPHSSSPADDCERPRKLLTDKDGLPHRVSER